MNDLPKRLREAAGWTDNFRSPYPVDLLKQAADRIEYLESVAGAVTASSALDEWRKMKEKQKFDEIMKAEEERLAKLQAELDEAKVKVNG